LGSYGFLTSGTGSCKQRPAGVQTSAWSMKIKRNAHLLRRGVIDDPCHNLARFFTGPGPRRTLAFYIPRSWTRATYTARTSGAWRAAIGPHTLPKGTGPRRRTRHEARRWGRAEAWDAGAEWRTLGSRAPWWHSHPISRGGSRARRLRSRGLPLLSNASPLAIARRGCLGRLGRTIRFWRLPIPVSKIPWERDLLL